MANSWGDAMSKAFERIKASLEDAIEYMEGRRQPDRSARLLLMVIDKHPEVVEEVITQG
jgi:hypothetical protein